MNTSLTCTLSGFAVVFAEGVNQTAVANPVPGKQHSTLILPCSTFLHRAQRPGTISAHYTTALIHRNC